MPFENLARQEAPKTPERNEQPTHKEASLKIVAATEAGPVGPRAYEAFDTVKLKDTGESGFVMEPNEDLAQSKPLHPGEVYVMVHGNGVMEIKTAHKNDLELIKAAS